VTEYGIDVSGWNAINDARAVRDAGITFAWCKATQGTGFVDASFAPKVAQLRAAGIAVGAYHYLDGSDSGAQARHFAAVAGPVGCLAPGALAPMLDMEDASARGNANNAVVRFYDTLTPGLLDVYGNLDWWTRVLVPARWDTRHVVGHIARYNGKPGDPGYTNPVLGVHQHSDAGKVAGIPGAVDRDATMPGWTLSRLRLAAGHGTYPVQTTLPPAPVTPGDAWVVLAGDTLSRIASAWGATVSAVAAANGIPDPNKIYPGQVIHRPESSAAAPPPAVSPTGAVYVVQAGDTVSGIAAREHTTTAVLVALNHLSNPDRIQVGQRLALPGPGLAGGGGADRTYTVRPGDTLGVIAARLHYPGGWPGLAAHNHLADANRITAGQTLRY
jgi:LysM repeat protein